MTRPGGFEITLQHGDAEYIIEDVAIFNVKREVSKAINKILVVDLAHMPEFNINVRLMT